MTEGRAQVQQLARVFQYQLHPAALKRAVQYLDDWAPLHNNNNNSKDTNSGGANNDGGEAAAARTELLRALFASLQRVSPGERFVDAARMEAAIATQRQRTHGAAGNPNSSSGGGPEVLVVPLAAVPRVSVDEISEEVAVVDPTGAAITAVGAGGGGGGGGAARNNRLQALRQRYLLARRRCLRSGLYRRDAAQALQQPGASLPLLPTTALEGIGAGQEVAVLGALFYDPSKGGEEEEEGRYRLEDLRGAVPLTGAVASAADRDCFLAAGHLVVAHGRWLGTALLVHRLCPPPPEPRERALRDLGPAADAFGLWSAVAAGGSRDRAAVLAEQRLATDAVLVVLAHVHMDQPAAVARLAAFLQRMDGRAEAELAATTLLLAGDFCAVPGPYGDAAHLRTPTSASASAAAGELGSFGAAMEALAECIATHAPRTAQHSRLVLVPGPRDLSAMQGVLPQPPVPAAACRQLRARVRRLVLAPNPCRLRFLAHEMVLARRDFLSDMQGGERQLFPGAAGAPGQATAADLPTTTTASASSPSLPPGAAAAATTFDRVCRSVVSQAHLAPEVQGAPPVLWSAEDALRLPVLPHTLLLCDATAPWEALHGGARCLNPGSFTANGTFLWYTPCDGEYSLNKLD